MSYAFLVQNFSLLLDPKWEDLFKAIMESLVFSNNSFSISTGNLVFKNQELEKEIQDKKAQKSALDYQKETLGANILKLRNEYCIANEKKNSLNLVIAEMQKKIETLKTEEEKQKEEKQNVLFLNKDIQDKKIKSLEIEIETSKQKIDQQNKKIKSLENITEEDQLKISQQKSILKKLFACFLLMGSAVFVSSLYLWSISAKTI